MPINIINFVNDINVINIIGIIINIISFNIIIIIMLFLYNLQQVYCLCFYFTFINIIINCHLCVLPTVTLIDILVLFNSYYIFNNLPIVTVV